MYTIYACYVFYITHADAFRSTEHKRRCQTVGATAERVRQRHSDFMVSKFQCHMEDGLFHVSAVDVLDIGGPHFIVGTVNVMNYVK